jgi:hypothetical protein
MGRVEEEEELREMLKRKGKSHELRARAKNNFHPISFRFISFFGVARKENPPPDFLIYRGGLEKKY